MGILSQVFYSFCRKTSKKGEREQPMNSKQQEKLINAITYFVNNTSYCNKVKLFKLLYFLDFEHFSEAGKSVTGLDYYAWKKGPVPLQLKYTIQEILNGNTQEEDESSLRDILNSSFSFYEDPKSKKLTIEPKMAFISDVFTRREHRILQKLVEEYKNKLADEMILATHNSDGPWDITYKQQPDERIDYFLALTSESPVKKEEVLEREFENKEIRMSYGLK